MQTAVGLISGGLDSCVAAYMAREDHNIEVKTGVTILYGQRHDREVSSAKRVCAALGINHIVLDVPLRDIIQGSSALLNPSEALPHDRAQSAMTARVPRSYVPGRNTIMLAIAQSIAEAYEYDHIITGFNAVDFSGYPDCRPIFVDAWNHLARYATKRGYENNAITLVAPIINMAKASVVYHGIRLGAPLGDTWSCYEGGALACGRCDSCIIRRNAFRENGREDPITYEEATHD